MIQLMKEILDSIKNQDKKEPNFKNIPDVDYENNKIKITWKTDPNYPEIEAEEDIGYCFILPNMRFDEGQFIVCIPSRRGDEYDPIYIHSYDLSLLKDIKKIEVLK